MTEQPAPTAVKTEFRLAGSEPGADAAFDLAATVSHYQSPLLRYAMGLLRGRHDQAQDIVQEAFIRLHRHVAKNGIDTIRDLTSWLYRVVHNLAIDQSRRRKTRDRAESEPRPVNDQESVLGRMIRKEACRTAMAELDSLAEPRRQLIMLKVVEGLTLRQVADVTGMSVGNVNYHLGRGMKELSHRLRMQQVL